LNIEIENFEQSTVVSPVGDVDTIESTKLREKLKPILASDVSRIVIDLTQVKYMDSSGIATLIEALQICKLHAKQFVICGLQDGVRSIIELARLDTIFIITKNREEALVA
jgi:anti-sigma B factor antagonist|tara:strand:- start:647 stop:976 length:330 start_codon:yes stop_codon:yes gene_type:complete